MASTDHRPGISLPGSAAANDAQPVLYRQGDVLLMSVPELPEGAVSVRRRGRIVLAEGEVTGHAHVIAERDAREFRMGDERYILVRSAARLVHEEHAPIDVELGTYRVVIQREYEPAPVEAAAWRRVRD